MKALKDWTFQELVDYQQGSILKHLLKGNFENGVWLACDHAIR